MCSSDLAVFEDADHFRIGRSPNPHLAFAAGGHACAGMSVARIEGEIAIGRFLTRLPGAMLAGTPEVQRRARFRGYARCEVTLR